MEDNSIQASYDITQKSKLRKFYEEKRILIISISVLILIIIASMSYLSESKKRKNILLSDNYIKAKIYISEKKILKLRLF